MVTNHKMNENEMGYRGSKSKCNFNNKSIQNKNYNIVKEQRVDGSCFINNTKLMKLRYTLMGFERNYQTKIPSKQFVIQTKNFSTNSLKFCQNLVQIYTPSINSVLKNDVNNNKLNPWFVTGFTDAEGCIGLYIYKNANYKTGWFISLVFQISLHEKDKIILEQIQNYFGVGGLTSHGSTSLKYSVRSHKDLQIIIDHFDKFPLITNKLNDYKLFKLAYILFLKKEQLTLEGIKKLVSIKSSMNLGLSPELKTIFSNLEPEKKREYF